MKYCILLFLSAVASVFWTCTACTFPPLPTAASQRTRLLFWGRGNNALHCHRCKCSRQSHTNSSPSTAYGRPGRTAYSPACRHSRSGGSPRRCGSGDPRLPYRWHRNLPSYRSPHPHPAGRCCFPAPAAPDPGKQR